MVGKTVYRNIIATGGFFSDDEEYENTKVENYLYNFQYDGHVDWGNTTWAGVRYNIRPV